MIKRLSSKDVYYSLVFRLTGVLLLFIFTRILFLLFNYDYFNHISIKDLFISFTGGLVFDISAILIINFPFILLQTITINSIKKTKVFRFLSKFLFVVINGIALASNCIDFIYFRFTLKRMTYDVFTFLGMGDDMQNLTPEFIKNFWYILLIWTAILIGLFYIYKLTVYELDKRNYGIRYFIIRSILFVVTAIIVTIGMRGGIQFKPVNIISAANYADSHNIPLVLNTPFTIIKSYKNSSIERVRYFKSELELKKIYTPLHYHKSATFRKDNVVVIILESFSKEHIGFLNSLPKDKSITPFLDSLCTQSLVLTNAYANGKRSIEGVPAILSGIPTLMNDAYIASQYSGDKINSLAAMLSKKGYTTMFYHGGTNGTMRFDNYSKIAGFDKYYGRTEYNNDKDYDGCWGIFDLAFYKYFASNLNQTKEPFFTGFFSLSSHHPYTIEEKFKNVFNKGNNIQRSINYSDYALKKFFEVAKTMKWFDNTLFIITADHTSEIINKEYENSLGIYAIPIIFYRHNSDMKGVDNRIAQQIDIMPTVLDYLNYNEDYFAFGNNLLENNSNTFAISYLNNTYQLIKDDYVINFDGKQVIDMFKYTEDYTLKHNIVNSEQKKAEEMEVKLKAIIQTYNNRVLDNKLTEIK